MKITDKAVTELIDAAGKNREDIYFFPKTIPAVKEYVAAFSSVGGKTLLVFPGVFAAAGLPELKHLGDGALSKVMYVSCNELSDLRVSKNILSGKISRVVVPFAECALGDEYGYKRSLAHIGDLRNERRKFLQVTAVISSDDFDIERYREIFDSGGAYTAGSPSKKYFRAVKTDGKRASADAVLDELTQRSDERVTIFCSTRREAKRLFADIAETGRSCYYFDGTVSFNEAEKLSRELAEDPSGILVATKSAVPFLTGNSPGRIIYFGLPYSFSHAFRCTCGTDIKDMLCVWCEDDLKQSQRIIESHTEALSEFISEDIKELRHKKLKEVYDFVGSYDGSDD